jgi:hypothetical protein
MTMSRRRACRTWNDRRHNTIVELSPISCVGDPKGMGGVTVGAEERNYKGSHPEAKLPLYWEEIYVIWCCTPHRLESHRCGIQLVPGVESHRCEDKTIGT